jgi:NTE family protein
MIKNLVISGGSMRGFTFLGALLYLEHQNILNKIDYFCGTSIGACISLCLNLDFTINELIDIFTNIDIEKHRNITFENVVNFLDTFGFDDGEKIMNIFKILIDKKLKKLKLEDVSNNDLTFKKLYDITQKKLLFVGCCLNTMETVFFSAEHTPEMLVLDALRITFSIPFLFKPILLKDQYYVDGGLTNNYPIELFNSKETLGLVCQNDNNNKKINNIEHYLISVLSSSFFYEQKKKNRNVR